MLQKVRWKNMAGKKITLKITPGCRCENVIRFRYIWWDNTKTVRKSRQGKFSRTSTDCISFVCFTIPCMRNYSLDESNSWHYISRKTSQCRLNTCHVASDTDIIFIKIISISVLTCLNFIKYLLFIICYFVVDIFNFIIYTIYSSFMANSTE